MGCDPFPSGTLITSLPLRVSVLPRPPSSLSDLGVTTISLANNIDLTHAFECIDDLPLHSNGAKDRASQKDAFTPVSQLRHSRVPHTPLPCFWIQHLLEMTIGECIQDSNVLFDNLKANPRVTRARYKGERNTVEEEL
jgi:hypothetical protein